MLSFLWEQGFDSLHDKQQQSTENNTQNEQTQQQEYVAVAAKNKNVRKTTYLLVVLSVIGLLCLLYMIKKSVPQAASASLSAEISTEQAQIERAIAQITGVRSEMLYGIERVVKKFYEFSDVQQVQVDELVKNPFSLDVFVGMVSENSDIKRQDFDIDGEMIGQQLRQEAKNLQLLSIMATDTDNCCMINDRILYEGDSIKGFKVRQISDSSVKLEWARTKSEKEVGERYLPLGTQIILKLSE